MLWFKRLFSRSLGPTVGPDLQKEIARSLGGGEFCVDARWVHLGGHEFILHVSRVYSWVEDE